MTPSSAPLDLPAAIQVFGAVAGEEELAALAPALSSGWMGMGPRVEEFEQAMAERLATGFVMTDSGSNALHLAVEALELPPGSDVLVPSFTWVACAGAVLLAGHRPVFADVDPATGNVSAETLDDARTPRTRAAMVVHYAGLPVAMSDVASLGLPIIEDAAHAVDSRSGGRPCATIGAIGVFSFDSVKNVATPGGGGVASPDAETLSRVRALRNCGARGTGHSRAGNGRWWVQEASRAFPRATPNDISAAIGLVQLKRLSDGQLRRRQIWECYDEGLGGVPGLRLPPRAPATDRHSHFTYLIGVEGGRRDALAVGLLEHGVYTTLRFHPLHLNPAFAPQPRLPGCELLAEQGLNLPLHPRMTDGQVERVIELVGELL